VKGEEMDDAEIRALEERDRDGYAGLPQRDDESLLWESVAAWPLE
jgi:hypothetical protein